MSGARFTTERRYTLAEAKAELIRRECTASGHDWGIVWSIPTVGKTWRSKEPLGVGCARCNKQIPLQANEGGA